MESGYKVGLDGNSKDDDNVNRRYEKVDLITKPNDVPGVPLVMLKMVVPNDVPESVDYVPILKNEDNEKGESHDNNDDHVNNMLHGVYLLMLVRRWTRIDFT